MSDSEEPETIPVEFTLFSHLSEKLTPEQTSEAEKIIKEILHPYAASAEDKPLVFPKEFSPDLRKIVHTTAEALHLSHLSKGGKDNRVIIVARKKEYLNIDIAQQKKAAGVFVDVPNPVAEAYLENATSTSMKVKWTPPDCNNKPITMYLVEVISTGPHKLYSTSINEVLITELEPNTIYSIVIKAQNEEGIGYVDKPFNFRTLRDASEAGAVYSWGLMDNNQLAFNSTNDKFDLTNFSVVKPTPVVSLGMSVIQIESNNSGTGIMQNGVMFRFGSVFVYNSEAKEDVKSGFIGDGKHENVEGIKSEPYEVEFPLGTPPRKTFICQISCGEMFGLALSTSGEVFSWGTNGFGELGIGTAIDCVYSINPVLAKFPANTFIAQIASGTNHSIALSSNHEVYVWGKKQSYYHKDYEENLLLDNSVFVKQAEPRKLKSTDIEGVPLCVYAGGESCAILNSIGELMTFGDNDMGQIGIGEKLRGVLHVPKRLEAFHQKNGKRVLKVSVGYSHSLAIVEEPSKVTGVYAWGYNKKGQCGIPSAGPIVDLPTKIEGTENITKVSAGGLHSLFLDSEGYVWACGDASQGAVGLSTELKGKISTKKRLPKISAGKTLSIFAGVHTSFAIISQN